MELARLHFGPADWLGRVSHVRHAFDMRGLGEHVQGDYLRHFKDTLSAQNVQISRHGGGVAGNVDDLPRLHLPKQFEHFRVTPFARRIEQHAGGLGLKLFEDLGKVFFSLASHEFAVGPIVQGRVPPSRLDRQPVVFDSDKGFNQVC
jgi:hypothetical protein